MNQNPSSFRPGLAIYAKLLVLAVFVLIFLGGLVTSWGAGMAVPDWPLSFGSLNPTGWWANSDVRLEHGHRLVASIVGLLTMLLCSWAWRSKWLVRLTGIFFVGLIYSIIRGTQHQARSPQEMGHAGWWVALIILVLVGLYIWALQATSPAAQPGERSVRWLVFAAFVAVCLQATLGGLRVTGQTAGALPLALALRIFHACVAQAFLCCVVAAAVALAPARPPQLAEYPRRRLQRLGFITVGAIYLQLVVGAVMRHLGAGLAISTFPEASPTGSWLPAQHNAYVDANFTHTRLGALVVTALVLHLIWRVWRTARQETRLVVPAVTLLALTAVQITLGVLVIFHGKPPTLTTFHVVNGAALLATSLWLTLRCSPPATQAAPSAADFPPLSTPVVA